jgi:ABC-type polysaccharide transport system permease subunit
MHRFFLELIAKPSHMEESAPCKVFGTLRATFIKLLQFFYFCLVSTIMSHSCQCQVQVLTLLELKVPHFIMYVVIKKCIIAVILENLSHHQLHNRSTSNIGIFGHINVI